MATEAAVNAGSACCRDCGGRVTSRGGLAWCENDTNTSGSQVDPKDHCDNLAMHDRVFCEHCRHRVGGAARCPCGTAATRP